MLVDALVKSGECRKMMSAIVGRSGQIALLGLLYHATVSYDHQSAGKLEVSDGSSSTFIVNEVGKSDGSFSMVQVLALFSPYLCNGKVVIYFLASKYKSIIFTLVLYRLLK